MKLKNNKALKEWATIVKALGEGKQTILIRKGELKSTYDEFFLYPTFTAQTKDKFKGQFHLDFDATVTARAKGKVMIEFYAQIKEVCEVTKSKKLLDLVATIFGLLLMLRIIFRRLKTKNSM